MHIDTHLHAEIYTLSVTHLVEETGKEDWEREERSEGGEGIY